jgi:hypothetical protein
MVEVKSSMSAPVSGYMWDPTLLAVRPVDGIFGASSLGPPLFGSGVFRAGAISPNGSYALLTNAQQILLASLPSGQPAALSPALSPTQKITFSPSGNSALVYAGDAHSLLLVTGMPGTPEVKTLALAAGGSLTQAAVSDTGLILIVSRQASGGDVIATLSLDGTPHPFSTMAKVAGAAFLSHADSAVIADAGANTISLASGLDKAPNLTQIAGPQQGIAQPYGVAASADGHWAIVGNTQSASIVRLDITGQSAPLAVKCLCTPSILWPLTGTGIFQLTPAGSGAVWVFDGDRPQARTVFIADAKAGAK